MAIVQGRAVDRHAHTAAWTAARVREQISAGDLAPGVRLAEQALASELGVSRNTLREAFATLAAESIVVRIPNRGVRVARPGPEDVRELYRARRVLEPGAVRGAEPGPGDLCGLDAIAGEAMDALDRGDGRAMADANQRFHRALVGLAGSTTLIGAMDRLLARMRLVFGQMPDVSGFHASYVPRNLDVVRLLREERPEDAATVLIGYLDDAEAELLDQLASTRSLS